MVQDHGGHRRLLRADPDHERSAGSSAYGGAKDFRQPPRRHPARAGAAFLAHAVGYSRSRNGGYRRADEPVEGREVTLSSSFRGARSASPESITTTGSMDSGPAPQVGNCRPKARPGMTAVVAATPRPSASARRGGSGLPRSIRTAP